jgi:hypothetical protein
MFEHHSQAVVALPQFIRRLILSLAAVLGLVLLSLVIGAVGYQATEHMSWIDAVYNAALILSGMGPATTLTTVAGKLFASVYAIYSGLFLISATAILFTPVFHRLMHNLHLDAEQRKAGKKR